MRRLSVIILGALLLSLAVAEKQASAAALTIEECVERALQQNPGYRAALLDADMAREEIIIAKSALMPSLRLRAYGTVLDRTGIFRTPENTFAPGFPPYAVDTPLDNRLMYGVSGIVDQALYAGGALQGNYKRSRILQEEAGHSVAHQRNMLVFDVKRAFHQLVREELIRSALERVVVAKRERRRVVIARQHEGLAEREEVLLVDADVAGAELALTRSGNRVALARTKLANLMNEEDSAKIQVASTQSNQRLAVSLSDLKNLAYTKREDIKASENKIVALQEAVSIARSEYYPKINMQGSYTAQRETNIDRPSIWALMLKMEWPIFEWGRTGAQVKKSELAVERARHEHAELLRAAALEVEGAWRDVEDREQEVRYQEKRIAAAEYIGTKTAARYRERSVRLAELLQAEGDLISAYHDYIAALHDVQVGLARLEASVMRIDERWISQEPIREVSFWPIAEAKKSPAPKAPSDG
ncbi:MAG TPA: TolC family protein, partial [Dissulfurispiraceae bacterium]|nr:TolC family protein [Dissulfurispiraceae bacterium]